MRRPTTKPLVSIGMPVYNAERYVSAAIERHLEQSLGDFELIISDNASTDRTGEICERFAGLDSRIRYIRQERNLGANRNHEITFRAAATSTEFFRWAASDDIPDSRLLEHCVEQLSRDARAAVIVPDVCNIDAEGQILAHVPRTLDLISDDVGERVRAVLLGTYQMVFTQGLMRRHSLAPRAHRRNYFGWDFVLLLELALKGRVLQPEGPFLFRRFHPGAASRIRTLSGLKAWVDPTLHSRFLMPHWRLSFERICAVVSSDLPPVRRAQVLSQILLHAWWTRQSHLRDLASGVALALGRTDEVNF